MEWAYWHPLSESDGLINQPTDLLTKANAKDAYAPKMTLSVLSQVKAEEKITPAVLLKPFCDANALASV